MGKINKTTRANGNRKIVGAILKHLKEPVTFHGVTYTPSRLAKMFQSGIDVADVSDATKRSWHAAVATEREKMQELSGLQDALRKHVDSLFGANTTEFTDFGFAPRKVTTPDAATKAAAVEKRAATRAARHTTGKRQKAEIPGDAKSPAVDAPTAGSTPVPAVPASPAPQAQSNGATVKPVATS